MVSLAVSVLAIAIMVIVMVRRAYRHSYSELEPLLQVDRSPVNVKILKQLLPLLAYPIIFFTLVLFPVMNRLYDAFSNGTGFVLAVTQGATLPAAGLFAGMALLIHVCCLQCAKNETKRKTSRESDNLDSQYPSSSFANLSTTVTRFSLQRESEVDENLRHTTGNS